MNIENKEFKNYLKERFKILDLFAKHARDYELIMDNINVNKFLALDKITALWFDKTDNRNNLLDVSYKFQDSLSKIVKEKDLSPNDFNIEFPLNLTNDNIENDYVKLFEWNLINSNRVKRQGFLIIQEKLERYGFDFFYYLMNREREEIKDYELVKGINMNDIQDMSIYQDMRNKIRNYGGDVARHILILDKRYWKSINAPDFLQDI